MCLGDWDDWDAAVRPGPGAPYRGAVPLPAVGLEDARHPVLGELVLTLLRDVEQVEDAGDDHGTGLGLREAEHGLLPRVLDPPLGLLLGRGRLGGAVEPPRLAGPVGGDRFGPELVPVALQ